MPRLVRGLLVAWALLVVAWYYRRVWFLVSGGDAWSWPDLGLAGATGLPFLRDALGRGVRGVAAASLVLAAAWTSGVAVRRLLNPEAIDGCERAVLELSLGVGTLGLLLLALAFAGLYTPAAVTALSVVLALAGLAGLAVRMRGRPVRWRARTHVSGFAWLTLIALGLAFVCATAPETEYDALWYHLELPRRWLAAGRPVDDVTEYVSLYPLHWELLYGAALPLGGGVGARLLHWAMLPACGAVTVLWARRLEAPPWLAGAVFVTAPTVLWEGTTAYADLALALHVGVAGWSLVRARDDRRWLAVSAVAFGFACATKHLGLVALASGVLVHAVAAWRDGVHVRRIAADALLIGTVAIAIASPWYGWSAARSGNPVFPELYRVFGAAPPERWSPDSEEALGLFKAHFGRPRTPVHQLTLPWHFTMHGTVYGGTFGPLLLATAPAVLIAMRRRRAAAALGAAAAIYVLVWMSPLSSLQARFLLPAWMAAAPLVALALATVMPHGRVARAVLMVILAMNLPPFVPLHEGDREGWNGWLTHVPRMLPVGVVAGAIGDDAYLRQQVRSYGAWQWIDDHVPPRETILSLAGGDQFYTRHPRLPGDAEAARAITWWARSPPAALAALEDAGIHWLIVPEPRIRTLKEDRLPIVEAIRDGAIVPLYRDTWYGVYRVEADALSRASRDQR